MRIARFVAEDTPAFGIVEGTTDGIPGEGGDDAAVAELNGHPLLGAVEPTGRRYPLADVRLVAPVLPTKIVGVGVNYPGYEDVTGVPGVRPVADGDPLVFLKPSTSVVGPGEPVAYPDLSDEVWCEGELAVVVGRICRQVPVDRAGDVIFGYTCANDLTALDLLRREPQWTRAKGFDSFCPLGPWIETDLDPGDLALTTTVTGGGSGGSGSSAGDELRQAGRTSEMFRTVAELLAYVTEAMTLLPGDVLLTGTPAGAGPVRPGERVNVTVEGLGTLTNPVVDAG